MGSVSSPDTTSTATGRAEQTGVSEPCSSCHVQSLGACALLEPAQLDQLARISDKIRLSAREVLFEAKSPVDCVYTVLSGALKLYQLLPDGQRQIVGFPYPGDSLGLSRFGRDHAFTAEALTETTLCRASRVAFEGLLEKFPALARGVLGKATEELFRARSQMILLGRMTALQRVAVFLLHLVDHPMHAPGTALRLPMTRADIADYLGLTTETVSRSFSTLRQRRWIRIDAVGNVHLDGLMQLRQVIAASLDTP